MLSIVIRAKNERTFLGQVLQAVLAQDETERFEVIVIDSGSTDGTTDLVRRFPVRLYEIPPEKFTFGYALNYGANVANGRIVIYLSAHCTPTMHSWMRDLVGPLQEDSALVATYGRQEPRRRVNPFEESWLWTGFPPDEKSPPAAPFSNANCAVWRTVLMDNPFDESIEFAEDLVWSRKFECRQIRYVPKASVYHSHPLSLRYWARRFQQDGAATVRMREKYGITNPYANTHKSALRDFLEASLDDFQFMIRRRYFRFLPLVPVFHLTRGIYFPKGMRQASRKPSV